MRKFLRKKVFRRVLTIAIILLCGVAVTLYYVYVDDTPNDGWAVGMEYVGDDNENAQNADEGLRDSVATDKANSTAHTKYHKTHGPD